MKLVETLKANWRAASVVAAVVGLVLGVGGAVLLQRNTLPQVVTPPDDPLRSEQTDLWLEAVRSVSRDGDWLVLRGYNHTDHLVATATNQPFSHVAILDVENDAVVEAMAGGVRVVDLRERLHESHHVMVMRPRWSTQETAAAAIEVAREMVGSPYDLLGTVGVGSRERFYCSELALHIYRDAFDGDEDFSGVIEPGHMYLWADILWDSRVRSDSSP